MRLAGGASLDHNHLLLILPTAEPPREKIVLGLRINLGGKKSLSEFLVFLAGRRPIIRNRAEARLDKHFPSSSSLTPLPLV